MRFNPGTIKKYIPLIVILVVLGVVLYNMNMKEGFAQCTKENCKGEYEWIGGKCVLTCQNIWKGSSTKMDKDCKPTWTCKDTGYSEARSTRNLPAFTKSSC